MAVTTAAADAYIDANVIVVEDWDGSDSARKQRILNVAERTLANEFTDYTIPDDAIYEYSAVLATAFNDTNKLAQQGVAGVSITGVASTTFAQDSVKSMHELIPKSAYDIINANNADKPKLGRVKIGRYVI